MRLRGIQINISPGNFEKSSCLSPLFLHYDSHFNPPSLIKRNFATRGGGARARARGGGGGGGCGRTHRTPTAYGPAVL